MTELVVAEEHGQIYDLWLERGERNLAVCHVDFHCDMRGLLIDRKRGKTCFVDTYIPYVHHLDSGSYLSHAVMNGIVTKLRWVHDDFGGRKYDYVHCVKYESDFSALPYRLLGAKRAMSVEYSEQTFADWGGPQPGEHLDIDWDAIAHIEYDQSLVSRLMAEILDRDYTPESIFVARSPGYCNPDQQIFEEFIAGLETKFKVKATRLPPAHAFEPQKSIFWDMYRKIDHGILKLMHKMGLQ